MTPRPTRSGRSTAAASPTMSSTWSSTSRPVATRWARSPIGKFVTNVKDTLLALSALDSEGAYSDGQAAALAGVLIPDVITYDTATHAVGPLNGRRLADDVIDVELNITTGGDPLGPFADRKVRHQRQGHASRPVGSRQRRRLFGRTGRGARRSPDPRRDHV